MEKTEDKINILISKSPKRYSEEFLENLEKQRTNIIVKIVRRIVMNKTGLHEL